MKILAWYVEFDGIENENTIIYSYPTEEFKRHKNLNVFKWLSRFKCLIC